MLFLWEGTQGFVTRKCSLDHRESWTAESQTCMTPTCMHTCPVRDMCVFAGGGDKREQGRAMFTLSFCFPPYKSQSHNISFSTASWAAPRPRLVDGVVIWHHKTSLQRAFPHSNIYWPIKHRVIWVKRVPVFRCSPLTERCRLGERLMRLAIVRQLAGSAEWLHAGYVWQRVRGFAGDC